MTRPRIAVVTTSRADFGIYRSVLAALSRSGELDYGLLASGMHLSPEFGMTLSMVRESGHPVWDCIEGLVSSDSDVGTAKSMGLTTLGFADSLGRLRPDLLLVLGDRFEMHAAALAAVPMGIPIAHIHGGEETEGAIDNALRHSLTKLASLHFPATALSARRIRAMGERDERVIIAGAPALDGLAGFKRLSREELAARFALPADGPYILATYHPVTLDPEASRAELEALWAVLEVDSSAVVFTKANADAAGRAVNARLEEMAASSERMTLVGTMGAEGYFSAMAHAELMIGNSSSGIIEAASFGLPVINIGDRQKGRERSANTIDTPGTEPAIRAALQTARSKTFREQARSATNVYGQGDAGERMAQEIARFLKEAGSARKRFVLEDRA
ncbi:UDP-N-acetylglucosamine 2-epimerase [Glycocaulis sp.]|uniref:UDP-N-acetylglucosamine 2-epimerase n=1 Tax=Glycocaulis sp. TaxID=1969725 RepID=UPI003D1D9E92